MGFGASDSAVGGVIYGIDSFDFGGVDVGLGELVGDVFEPVFPGFEVDIKYVVETVEAGGGCHTGVFRLCIFVANILYIFVYFYYT